MLVTSFAGPPSAQLQRLGYIHVHAAECVDLKRGALRARNEYDHCTEEHDSVQSVVESFYGPGAGSFYAEAGIPEEEWPTAWEGYADDFHFAPCLSELPNTRPGA
jgi:hypothetical protein